MSDSDTDHKSGNKLNHTRNLGNKQFSDYIKSQPSLANILFSIQKYLEDHQVNPFYLTSILTLNKGFQIETLKQRLHQEYQLLLNGKSLWHKIHNAIISREKCIQKIKRSLQKSQETLRAFKKAYYNNSQSDDVYVQLVDIQGYNPVEIDQSIEVSIRYLNSIFTDMSRLRDMTIYIIEQIHQWRVKVQQKADKCAQHRPIYFLHNQQDFYTILQKDIRFIWTSKLSDYILMQDKNDPLLIRNIVKIQKKQQKQILEKYFLEIMYPKNEEVVDKAIRCLQMMIYKYVPRTVNVFEQEEALIQNYLNMQRKVIGQKEQNEGLDIENQDNFLGLSRSKVSKRGGKSRVSKTSRVSGSGSPQSKAINWQERQSRVKGAQKLNLQSQESPTKRGWVFGKQLKPGRQRIKDIVQKHQNQMQINLKNQMKANLNMRTNVIAFASKPSSNHLGGYPHVKPFSIANFGQRRQLAHQYASESQEEAKRRSQKPFGLELQKMQKNKKIVAPYMSNSDKRKQFMVKLGRSKSSSARKYDPKNQISEEDQQISAQTPKEQIIRRNIIRNKGNSQRVSLSEDQKDKQDQKDPKNLTARMFQTLTKINPIIYQDPNQSSQHDTPRRMNNNIANLNNFFSANQSAAQSTIGREHSISNIKINTFDERLDDQERSLIQVDQQESPLDMKQFLQVFRPDTNTKYRQMVTQKNQKSMKKVKKHEKKLNFDSQQTGISSTKSRSKSTSNLNPNMRIYSIKELVQRRKAQRQHNLQTMQQLKKFKLPYGKFNKVKPKKSNTNSLGKSRSLDKSGSIEKSVNDSFKQYAKIQEIQNETIDFQKSPSKQTKEPYISLKSKTIPYDMIGTYVRHLIGMQHSTSKSFTSYQPVAIQKCLEDPYTQSFIFDLHAQGRGHIGQTILSQSLGNRRGLLRYKIQFLNVNNFELVIGSVARIAQQLLSSTPCEQFLCPFVVDKMDPVSSHFIKLIDQGLKQKSQKFAMFKILEKKKLGYKGQDMHQRVYVFNSKKTKATQAALGMKMMGNYRSVSFQTKCLLMASNFKLRSKSFSKSYITHFNNVGIGSLFIRVFEKILTNNHLKQIRTASMSINDGDQMVSLVKNSPFLRNVIYSLILYMKNKEKIKQHQGVSATRFNSIVDMINYLGYKQYDYYFHFQFLQESRFILNHDLVLSQFSCDISLEFMITSSPDFLLLGNYRNLSIEVIKSNEGIEDCYLLPTTQDKRKLLLMSGAQFTKKTTDKLDLFSYLSIFLRNQKAKYQLNDVPEVVIPNLANKNAKVNKIKMYQGLYRLFPQRQFYTGTMFNVTNHWEGYYPSAVVRLPHQDAIVIEYPIIVGFFNTDLDQAQVSFLLNQEVGSP